MDKISVVVPALTLTETIFNKTLAALNSVADPEIETIVVENGSFTLELMEVADIYVHYPKPVGFGKACNAGLKIATGDYLAICSTDVEYLEGSLKTLVHHYKEQENIGFIFPTAKNKGQVKDGVFHDNETEGSTFLFSRETYDKIKLPEGLYDDRYETGYYEDTDLWYRADKLGLRLVRDGFVLVNHSEGATTKHLGVYNSAMEANKKKFIEKWGELPRWRG